MVGLQSWLVGLDANKESGKNDEADDESLKK